MKKLLLLFFMIFIGIFSYAKTNQMSPHLNISFIEGESYLRNSGIYDEYPYLDLANKVSANFNKNDADNTTSENWRTFYSDNRIEIQFKYSECDDVQNDKYFSYYLIKIKNKTNNAIIVNYILGENEGDREKLKEISLQPNEEINGSCNSNDSRLRIFVNDRKNNAKPQKRPFMISKIKSYEI